MNGVRVWRSACAVVARIDGDRAGASRRR